MALPGMNKEQMEAVLRDVIENQELTIAAMGPVAEMLKAKFDALVKSGFTPEQALDIIKARGLGV